MSKGPESQDGAPHPNIGLVVLFHEQADELAALLPRLREVAGELAEIVFVDDCSTGTPLDAQLVTGALPTARIIRNPENLGPVGAMNRGLSEISSAYVHFLASDDSIAADFYAVARGALRAHPDCGLFSSRTQVLDRSGTLLGTYRLPMPAHEAQYLGPVAALECLYQSGSWFAGNATVFRAEPLRAMGGFDEELDAFSDAYCCYALAARHGACFEPRPLAMKRNPIGGRNVSIHARNETSKRLCRHAAQKMREETASLFSESFIRRFEARWAFNRYAIHFYKNDSQLAGLEALPLSSKLVMLALYARYRPMELLARVSGSANRPPARSSPTA